MTNVPQISGRMPNLGGLASGLNSVPVRKSSGLTPDFWKKWNDSTPRTVMIPAVVSTEIIAQRSRKTQTPPSMSERRRDGGAQRSTSCAEDSEGVAGTGETSGRFGSMLAGSLRDSHERDPWLYFEAV